MGAGLETEARGTEARGTRGAGAGGVGLSRWRGLEQLRPVLLRFLRSRCRDENEADDLIQETLLRAARYRRQQADGARLRAWVVQIATNVFRDHVRRAQYRPAVGCEEEVLEGLEDPSSAPPQDPDDIDLGGELVERQSALDYLSVAVEGLLDRDRRILASFYGGAQSTAVTAGECGISPALVKVRLFRARRRLARSIRLRAAEHRARRLVQGLGSGGSP